MANTGNNFGQDMSFTPGANALTTTSQYRVGYFSAAHTISVANTTTAHLKAAGIIQTNRLTAGSNELSFRMLGVSKAVCAGTCSVGDFVQAATNGGITAATIATTDTTVTTAGVVQTGIVGMAMESGITNQVIEILVNPGLRYGLT